MTLVKAWSAVMDDADPIPVLFAAAAAGDPTVFDSYKSLIKFNGYGYTDGTLWRDTNHEQRSVLYLPLIFPVNGAFGLPVARTIPAPSRDVVDEVGNPTGTTIDGLDLFGGRMDLTVYVNNVVLGKPVQMVGHVQLFDTEAVDGRGTNVNYLCVQEPSIDEVLGYTESYGRAAAGEQKTAGWVDVSIPFDGRDSSWIPIDGRPEKATFPTEVYGRSEDFRRALRTELLNIMMVFHCGPGVPSPDPPGPVGQVYCKKAELWVDDTLNPNLIV